MLTITPLSARGQSAAGADVLRYLIETEMTAREQSSDPSGYYAGHASCDAPEIARNASRWLGSGAAALGLDGVNVGVETMTYLSRGFAPDGTTALCQNAGEVGEWKPHCASDGTPLLGADGEARGRWVGGHRVGFDMTFSADKTISLAFALADDAERARIVAAHRDAVADAVGYLERQAETRRGKGGAEHQSAHFVASGHTHFGNRNLEPQLHEHVLLYNIAQGADGEWGTPEVEALFQHQRAAGALYRAALAHGMQRLGYAVSVEQERDARGDPTGEVWTHIAGIDPRLADAFSTRRAEIEERMRETGETAQEATLATRAEKEEPSFHDLQAQWRAQMDALREQGEIPVPRATADLKHGQADDLLALDDTAILREVQQGAAVWSRRDLLERVALTHAGRLDAAGCEAETDRLLSTAGVVECEPERMPESAREQAGTPARRYRDARYTTQEHLAAEDAVLTSAHERTADNSVRLEPRAVGQSVERVEREQGWRLSDEQRNAVRWVTEDTGGMAVLAGRAGTGKTSTSRAFVAAFQDQGRAVLGCAVGWDAAKKLEAESGIPSRSLASMRRDLDRGDLRLTHRSVVVLDEAGMVGTEDLRGLQKHIDGAGGKLVLLGDEHQLQSIDAGGLFGHLGRTIGSTALTEIRRQRTDDDRTTARLFYAAADHEAESGDRQVLDRFEAREQGAAVLERLEQRGQISRWGTRPEAIAALVDDYRHDARTEREKLIIAGTRADCRVINEGVRAAKRAAGELRSEDVRLSTADDGVVPVAVGDRVRFTKKDRERGVVNGTHGEVSAVERTRDGATTVHVRLDQDGREIVLSADEQQHLVHAYAQTVHRAQGQGRAAVYQLIHPGMADAQSSLVAFTRAVETFRAYGADMDLERIASRLGLDRRAWSAREAGVVRQEQQPTPRAPDAPTPERERGIER